MPYGDPYSNINQIVGQGYAQDASIRGQGIDQASALTRHFMDAFMRQRQMDLENKRMEQMAAHQQAQDAAVQARQRGVDMNNLYNKWNTSGTEDQADQFNTIASTMGLPSPVPAQRFRPAQSAFTGGVDDPTAPSNQADLGNGESVQLAPGNTTATPPTPIPRQGILLALAQKKEQDRASHYATMDPAKLALMQSQVKENLAKAGITEQQSSNYAEKFQAEMDNLASLGQFRTDSIASRNSAIAQKGMGANAADGLSPEALKMMSEVYRKTGQLPSFGMGTAAVALKKAVIDFTAKNATENGGELPDLASAQASFKANQGSLGSMQKMYDAVNTFEQTAGANLDRYINLAKKRVDTGFTPLNSLLRGGARMTGDPDQAAADAAQKIALIEIAKVLTNPNLTGQLSDSARNEVAGFDPSNATMEQTLHVAQLIRNDMGARMNYFQSTLGGIKDRIAGPGQSNPSSGASSMQEGTISNSGKYIWTNGAWNPR